MSKANMEIYDPCKIEENVRNLKDEFNKSKLSPFDFFKVQYKNCFNKKEKQQLKQFCKSIKYPVFYKLICDDTANYKNFLQPETVDWIITDPPYSKKYLHLYKTLGDLGDYALKPDGVVIVMVGQSYLPQVINLLSESLNYVWTMSYLTPGGQSPFLWQIKCNTFWKPLLIFAKNKYTGASFGDVIKTSPNNNDKNYHYWGQSVEGFDLIMKKFVFSGQTVLDPFVGGGASAVAALTNNCSFIGVDISQEFINKTEERIKQIRE